jgi:hypothetical protein
MEDFDEKPAFWNEDQGVGYGITGFLRLLFGVWGRRAGRRP